MDRETMVRGTLLGLAVGDAMGYPIDKKNWDEITESYGPNGLLGYDLMDGTADVTCYTQFAAYACNGMLLGACRGHYDRYIQYIAMSLREWAKFQQTRGGTERSRCWVAQVPELRRRLCMDTRVADALHRENLGTLENPGFVSDGPAAMTVAVAVALMYDPNKQTIQQMRRLAAEAVALVSGDRMTILAGAYLASSLVAIMRNPEAPLMHHFIQVCDEMQEQFCDEFPEVTQLNILLTRTMELTRDPELSPLAAMSLLDCRSGVNCLAGAMYAAMIHQGNFDEGMIASVNHSGYSGVTGALTGAFLGARLGAEELPEFYLESLEAAPYLEELAHDLVEGRQTMLIFDDHWDQKYVQGRPSRE